MVAVVTRHPVYPAPTWKLVGPWYRWSRPGHPEDGRLSRPAIQKFAGDDFIPGFLAHPQHSLKYDAVIDVVNNFDLVTATSSMAGKLSSFLPVSYTHLRAHETVLDLVCRLLLDKKNRNITAYALWVTAGDLATTLAPMVWPMSAYLAGAVQSHQGDDRKLV